MASAQKAYADAQQSDAVAQQQKAVERLQQQSERAAKELMLKDMEGFADGIVTAPVSGTVKTVAGDITKTQDDVPITVLNSDEGTLSFVATVDEETARYLTVGTTGSLLTKTGSAMATPAEITALQAVTYLGTADCLYVPGFLQGMWPTEPWGCVIDETAAYAIFGSGQVLGQSLNWGDSTYHITGIVKDNGGIGYFPITDKDNTAMSHLLLDLSQTGTGVFGAELVLNQLNISATNYYDLGLWVWLLKAAERLPIFMLWMDLSIAAVSLHRRMRRLSLLTCASSAGCLTAAVLLWQLAGFPSIPARLLPSRWSDFTFWATQAQRMADSVKALFQNGGTQWELTFWADLCLGFAAAIAAVITLGHLLRMGRGLTSKTVVAVSVLWWLLLLGVTYRNRAMAYAMVDITLLLALPVWLSLRWGLERYGAWLFGTGKEEAHETMAQQSGRERPRP